jgi:hypothetical protein
MINPLAYQLGNPRGEYRSGVGSWIVVILGAGLIALGLFGEFVVIRNGGDTSAMLALLVPIAFGGMFIFSWFAYSRRRVQVFDQGIVYTQGSKAQAWRWDDIAFVWQQITRMSVYFIPVATSYVYTVQHRNGQKIKLTNGIRNIKALGEMMQSETFTRLMPLAVAAYNNGETLHFGKLTISQQGIGNSKEIVPWAQVKGVEVVQGYVGVKREGKWLRWANIRVASVPNFFIFMALVDQITGVKR